MSDEITASFRPAARMPAPSMEAGAMPSGVGAPPLLPPGEPSVDVDAAALLETAKRVQDQATALFSEIGGALHGAKKFIEKNVEQHPIATLSAAAGAGYVVAGGLSSSLSKLALRTGTKIAAAWAIKKVTEAATGTKVHVEVEKTDEPTST